MDIDMADVKPSVLSWATVGLMSVTFILFFKWLTARYNIKFVSDAIASI